MDLSVKRPRRTRTRIVLTVCSVLVMPGAALAFDDRNLGSTYVFSAYGQLHFAYQSFDDGQATTENIVDVTNANSRLGFFIKPSDGGLGLSFQFESGLGFRPSQKTSQDVTPEFWNWSRRDLRQVQLIYKSDVGTFSLGQGSMPLDGVAESDLGGTVVAAKSTIPEANGAYLFRTSAGGISSITIGNTFDNYDGDRRFRLRYDTPDFGGFSLGLAYGEEVLSSGNDNTYYDAAVRYSESFGAIRVIGAIGSAWENTATSVTRVTIGSVSVMDDRSGLNASLAAGLSASGSEPNYIYFKGGWNVEVFAAGTTKLAFELFRGSDYITAGARSDMWSAGVIQNFDTLNLEAHVSYRAFSYKENTAVSYQDADTLMIGARWKF